MPVACDLDLRSVQPEHLTQDAPFVGRERITDTRHVRLEVELFARVLRTRIPDPLNEGFVKIVRLRFGLAVAARQIGRGQTAVANAFCDFAGDERRGVR